MTEKSRDYPQKILYYDIETDSKYAPYANLEMIGYMFEIDGFQEPPKILDLKDPEDIGWFAETLLDPEWTKVDFNGVNYDQIVLKRHGFPMVNTHDVFLMVKTVKPMLPAYGLKFLNWYYYNDVHEEERKMLGWCKVHGVDRFHVPKEMVQAYCKYDVIQTARLFKQFWPIVTKDLHWSAYAELEMGFAPVLHEMILEGGEYVNIQQIDQKIAELERTDQDYTVEISRLTNGVITNPRSSKQVGNWLREYESVELEISDSGNLLCRKEDIIELLDLENPKNDTSRIARIAFEIRDNGKQLGYLRAFREAAIYEVSKPNGGIYNPQGLIKIPKSYSSSAARTRRILSSSRFGINFQNLNKRAKEILLVPPGWIQCFIDLSQIENVFHIFATNDTARRTAWEKDTNYNEYVWIGNRVMGTSFTKKEMDNVPSPVNPSWSVYKQYKTCKLAMNFFMGLAKFCRTNKLTLNQGQRLFNEIHRACPAIKQLLHIVENEIKQRGYIQDPFGHIYGGRVGAIYKSVAYFVQGCGTGSIPKAMAREIYNTLHAGILQSGSGVMTGIIHDEIAFRIRVGGNSDVDIKRVLRDCLFQTRERFSPLFDGIPLRSKLYLTVTNAADAEELTENNFDDKVKKYIDRAIECHRISKENSPVGSTP